MLGLVYADLRSGQVVHVLSSGSAGGGCGYRIDIRVCSLQGHSDSGSPVNQLSNVPKHFCLQYLSSCLLCECVAVSLMLCDTTLSPVFGFSCFRDSCVTVGAVLLVPQHCSFLNQNQRLGVLKLEQRNGELHPHCLSILSLSLAWMEAVRGWKQSESKSTATAQESSRS